MGEPKVEGPKMSCFSPLAQNFALFSSHGGLLVESWRGLKAIGPRKVRDWIPGHLVPAPADPKVTGTKVPREDLRRGTFEWERNYTTKFWAVQRRAENVFIQNFRKF